MALLTLRDIHHSFGGPALLDGVDLAIESRERVGLVGRNGAGKSTLMKIVAGELRADEGDIDGMPGLRIAALRQDLPAAQGGTIFDVAGGGLGEIGRDAAALIRDPAHADRIANPAEAWAVVPRIETVLSRLDLDGSAEFDVQSGGIRRRALLARALVTEPDLLLLDEPTNHLDVASVEWLEGYLKSASIALLFVTHDRAFLQSVATRIAEVDRGKLLSWDCDYRTYLERRAQFLADEAAERERFDKRLADEEAWARQNVQARRTKSVARLKEVARMREQRAQRRELVRTAKFSIAEAERSGKLVVEAKGLTFGWGNGESLVRDLDTTILRKDRVGIIGPNGCGKTTLVRLLLGQLAPGSGSVRTGANVQVTYFDQTRDQLDPDATVADTVGEGNDHVDVGGRRRHVIGYLGDFLFEPARARSRVGVLSGGEQSRVLLAKLFLRPSNVLVLDEPTNDLDLETLELLEEKVLAYEGTVLVVSHDRAFLDAVCTSTLVFEHGNVSEYVGGYADWVRQRPAAPAAETPAAPPAATAAPARERAPSKRRLSFKEKRELEELPERISALEAEQEQLEARLADPALYQGDPDEIRRVSDRYEAAQVEWEQAYERLEELQSVD